MEIITDRLKLTEITWDDTEDIHHLHTFFEVDEFNTDGIPKDIEETKMKMAPFVEASNETAQSKYTWAIKKAINNEFVGIAGIKLSCDKFKIGEIFYKLLPSHWGMGYATEVSKKIIEAGFDTLQLHRIQAGCAVKNIKSARVLEKSGMTHEGVYRKILPIRGEWIDSHLYAIVEEDLR